MGYFANTTEGDQYYFEWCKNCIHEDPPDQICQIWTLHGLMNYDECNNKESILHMLIPIREDTFCDQCKMFYPIESPEGAK